jgi:hypothetical protein
MRRLVSGIKRFAPVIVCTIFAVVLYWSLRRAWTHTESDFPSYYTAAHLVLKREPLHLFYDMAWFQQQIDSLIVPSSLGGYIPQTPLTMLPFVPFAGVEMNTAKQMWLTVDIALLIGTVWLLTRLTKLGVSVLVGLLVLGFGTLHTNLLLGQYYVFILFLLTAAVYLLDSGQEFLAGAVVGVICSLKLITAPFFFYFAWRKQGRALAGMCTAIGLSLFVAVTLFGWTDITHYLGQILPRAMAGETLDPFNPANGTVTTLLRRLLIPEPELNPDPPLNVPFLFFFLRTLFTLSVLGISLLTFARAKSTKRSYAGFLIALIVISPNTASYTFLLLLLPTALLVESASLRHNILLVVCWMLLALPMRPAWSWLFPKVWLLLGMFWLALVVSGAFSRGRPVLAGLATAAVLCLLIAGFDTRIYQSETHQRWKRIVVERGAIYSSSPTPLRAGLLYQSISHGRYTLRLRREQGLRNFEIGGNAFKPVLLPRLGLIRFEFVRLKRNHQLLLDPETGIVRYSSMPDLSESSDLSQSPDGQWIVCVRNLVRSTQIYLLDQTEKVKPMEVTEGPCNSFAPAWERDSQAIVFASDCGRGLGMPALYRARLQDMLALTTK